MKYVILFFILFYILSLFQTSFFVHFPIFGMIPNGLIIVAVLIHLFARNKPGIGLTSAIVAGLFLDICSGIWFGFWTGMMIAGSLLLQFFMKQYVRIPTI